MDEQRKKVMDVKPAGGQPGESTVVPVNIIKPGSSPQPVATPVTKAVPAVPSTVPSAAPAAPAPPPAEETLASIPKFGELQPKVDAHPLFSGTHDPRPKKSGLLRKTLWPLISLVIVLIILYLLVDAGIIRGGSHLPFHIFKQPVAANQPTITSLSTPPQSTASTEQTANPYAGWQTFTSTKEGFSIKYPSDWTARNWSGTDDEAYDFKAPDGLIVRYISNPPSFGTDSASCGHQSACAAQTVLSIDSLTIPNYTPKVLLVKTAPSAADGSCYGLHLDQPSGVSTTPKVGENSYPDHTINYSLPNKAGGRLSIFTTNEWVPSTTSGEVVTFQCANLSQDQFFNTSSVQQAENILRSLSY